MSPFRQRDPLPPWFALAVIAGLREAERCFQTVVDLLHGVRLARHRQVSVCRQSPLNHSGATSDNCVKDLVPVLGTVAGIDARGM